MCWLGCGVRTMSVEDAAMVTFRIERYCTCRFQRGAKKRSRWAKIGDLPTSTSGRGSYSRQDFTAKYRYATVPSRSASRMDTSVPNEAFVPREHAQCPFFAGSRWCPCPPFVAQTLFTAATRPTRRGAAVAVLRVSTFGGWRGAGDLGRTMTKLIFCILKFLVRVDMSWARCLVACPRHCWDLSCWRFTPVESRSRQTVVCQG
jgi:hypothetical protein